MTSREPAVSVQTPHDTLRLIDGPARGYTAGWTGPWPPPETFTVAIGRQSGYVSIISPDADEADVAAAREIADFHTYRRRNASALPDDFASPHVFRGAEYVHQEPA